MSENIWQEYIDEIDGIKVGTKLLIDFRCMRLIEDKNNIDFPKYQFLCGRNCGEIDDLSKEELADLIKFMKLHIRKLEKKLKE